MVRGEAAEVVLSRNGRELFLAGLVAFCRHIERGVHEVGIQFVTHSVAPVLSGDSAAPRKLDWVAQSLSKTATANGDGDMTGAAATATAK